MAEALPLTGFGMIGRSSLYNLLGAAVPTVVALATVPAYLDVVGAVRYGVLTLAWLMLGYLGLAHLGIGKALANHVARLHDDTSGRRERLVWTALAVSVLFGIAGALVVYVLGWLVFAHALSLSPELRGQALDGLPWLALAVPFLLAAVACVGALEGVGRFGVVNVVEGTMTVALQLLPLTVAILWSTNLMWLMAAAATAPVVGASLALAACASRLGLGRPCLDRSLIRPVLALGGWMSVSGFVGPFLTVFDRFVVGAVLGPRAVAVYTIPLSLVLRFTVFPASICRAVFPPLSAATSTDAAALARRTTLVVSTLMTPVVVAGIVLAQPFLNIWVGGDIAEESAPLAEIALTSVWLNAVAFPALTFLQARGRASLVAKIHVLELAPYALALWIGLSVGGLEGAAVAWALRTGVDAAALVVMSGLHSRREARALAPFVAVLAAFGAARLFDGSGGGWIVSAALVGGTVAWALHARPNGLRLRLWSLWPTRAAP